MSGNTLLVARNPWQGQNFPRFKSLFRTFHAVECDQLSIEGWEETHDPSL